MNYKIPFEDVVLIEGREVRREGFRWIAIAAIQTACSMHHP